MEMIDFPESAAFTCKHYSNQQDYVGFYHKGVMAWRAYNKPTLEKDFEELVIAVLDRIKEQEIKQESSASEHSATPPQRLLLIQ